MTLTVPKIKDLVNAPPQKYENIYNIINKQNNQEQDYTLIDLLPKKDETNMKSELKSFLKSQLHNTNEGTSIEALDSANSYSTY